MDHPLAEWLSFGLGAAYLLMLAVLAAVAIISAKKEERSATALRLAEVLMGRLLAPPEAAKPPDAGVAGWHAGLEVLGPFCGAGSEIPQIPHKSAVPVASPR